MKLTDARAFIGGYLAALYGLALLLAVALAVAVLWPRSRP